jgi:hypothetical protein
MKPIGSLTDENRMFITILQDIKSIEFVHVKPQMCIISSEGSAQGLSSLVIDSLFEIKCTSFAQHQMHRPCSVFHEEGVENRSRAPQASHVITSGSMLVHPLLAQLTGLITCKGNKLSTTNMNHLNAQLRCYTSIPLVTHVSTNPYP